MTPVRQLITRVTLLQKARRMVGRLLGLRCVREVPPVGGDACIDPP